LDNGADFGYWWLPEFGGRTSKNFPAGELKADRVRSSVVTSPSIMLRCLKKPHFSMAQQNEFGCRSLPHAIEAGELKLYPVGLAGLIGIASTFLSIDPFLYAFVNNTRSSQKIINPKTMISGT
jgi:hypothetical protein